VYRRGKLIFHGHDHCNILLAPDLKEEHFFFGSNSGTESILKNTDGKKKKKEAAFYNTGNQFCYWEIIIVIAERVLIHYLIQLMPYHLQELASLHCIYCDCSQ